jgi:adenosylhomocysteine nucleosidase
MIALFAAMEVEVDACPAWIRSGEAKTLEGVAVIESEGAIVCQTGIGREAAQRSSALVLSQYAPSAALSVGLAGGLAPGVEVGEIVLCTHVDHESHRHSDVEQTVYSDQTLFEWALEVGEGIGVAVRTGTSLTVDEAAWGPAEKAAHHAWKSHDIVEMESFWIAEAAVRRGLPFLAVRAVSDSSHDTLPNIGATREDGSLDREKFMAHLEEHPETAELLSAVAQNSRVALASLGTYLEALCARLTDRVSEESS